MKKYFVTGLVILLPLTLTLAIFIFFFNLLTDPFAGIVQSLLAKYDLLDKKILFFSAAQIQWLVSKILVLTLLFFLTVALGVLARWFFFHTLIRFWDYLIHRIPFISSVYKTCQDVINTLFSKDAKSFKQVVFVPFPNENSRSIGLVTQDNLVGLTDNPLVAVFVPTTPNPTSGFLVLYSPSDLTYVDMKVEDAFKYVISCGMVQSQFEKVDKLT